MDPTNPIKGMRRPSQSGPEHRRATWARKNRSYDTYMKPKSTRIRPAGDYGMDNFAFAEKHVPDWQLSSELADQLPHQLKDGLIVFEQAGAAVDAALERIQGMDDEAVDR